MTDTLERPPPATERHPRRRRSPPARSPRSGTTFIADSKLVNPNNKRKFKVIVVGTGLAGASAAATLAELGYQVEAFTFHDSPRRAHSIAAQGGINAAKNYRGDGDSVYRLFYDTIKGGDFRSREANVYRLAQVSVNIIDQMVAQGVPFAREYGGLLDNRSFGGAQVSRTFYARGQTGQQLLLGAYQQMARQVGLGNVKLWNRVELVDIVVVDGRCAGIVTRDLLTGEFRSHAAHAVVLATGGYGNVFFLSTNAMACNVTAAWRAHRQGAYFANPCYTQIHPTCIPQSDDFQSKLTLMSESLRNDGRVWVPKDVGDERARRRRSPRPSATTTSSGCTRASATWRRATSRRGPPSGPSTPAAASARCKNGVYLDFSDAIGRLGQDVVEERYGNLFEMYERITGENPYEVPMRIYPASHYTMGGLWVDYELMTTVPGLYCAGEANFSDHGANRLGASALMQGLADGYFVLPYTIGNYLAPMLNKPIPGTDHPAFDGRRVAPPGPASPATCRSAAPARPTTSTASSARSSGTTAAWSAPAEGLEKALSEIPALYEEFQKDLRVTGDGESVNQTLEKAGRVDDFFELGMLMCRDALERRESCGGHFRAEYQTEEGEALRDDENFAHVAAWEWTGDPMAADPPPGGARVRDASTSRPGATSEQCEKVTDD